MATRFQEGDRVQIVDREMTADDSKSNLYYTYFRGLTGTIQKIYSTQEVAVEIDVESLAEAVAQRHTDLQEQMRSKWLDGLSEETRNRLSDKEKDLRLRYTVLVALNDLTAPGTHDKGTHDKGTHDKSAYGRSVDKPAASPAATPHRRTEAELNAAEEAYLRSRQKESRA